MHIATRIFPFLIALGSLAATDPTSQLDNNPASQLTEIDQNLGYFAFGLGPVPVPLPNFTFGYRSQYHHNGYDIALQVATVVEMTGLKASALYNYYFRPSLASELYMGIGPAGGVLFARHQAEGFVAPEFTIGQLYRNESASLRFAEVRIDFPMFYWHHDHSKVFLFPVVTLNYGWGF